MKSCCLVLLVLLSSFGTADELRVMSFNIRYGTANDGENHWSQRRQFLVQTVRSFDPDLLGTQETIGFQKEFLAVSLPAYTSFGVGREDGGQTGEMTAIFYRTERFDLLASGHFWLSEQPEVAGSKSWDSSLPRMASWVKLHDRQSQINRPILFINTHFDHIGKVARQESSELLVTKSKELGQGCDIVITGDFNSEVGSGPYRTLFADEKHPFIDSYARISSQNKIGNEMSGEATFSGFKADVFNGPRIDWIAVSGNWMIEQAQIDRTSRNGRTPSDHHPVTATIRQIK